MWKYLKHLFQLILSPGHGWEDIARSRIDYRALASSGFYPLTAVTAVTTFMEPVYHETATLSTTLMSAIVTFVMFFLGYFVATFLLSIFLGAALESKPSEQRYHTFTLYAMGLLELIAIIANFVPIPLAITFFLPVYVAIVMWKGARYLGVRDDSMPRFVVVTLLCVLAPPYLLMFLFNSLMPS